MNKDDFHDLRMERLERMKEKLKKEYRGPMPTLKLEVDGIRMGIHNTLSGMMFCWEDYIHEEVAKAVTAHNVEKMINEEVERAIHPAIFNDIKNKVERELLSILDDRCSTKFLAELVRTKVTKVLCQHLSPNQVKEVMRHLRFEQPESGAET